MLKSKKSFPWLIVIVVAVVASLATVAVLLLRAKARKRRSQIAASEVDNCACMSFDCCPEDCEEDFAIEEEATVEDIVEE